jgi:hypothetical protein
VVISFARAGDNGTFSGRYVAQVEGTNGFVAGTARMLVRVVPPEIAMSSINSGKYGAYIDITNPNHYDLDISGWKISVDGGLFSFPKNTLLAEGLTHFSGLAMGFASTTVSSSTIIKLLFPNMEEVLRLSQGGAEYKQDSSSTTLTSATSSLQEKKKPVPQTKPSIKHTSASKNVTTLSTTSTVLLSNATNKDTRLASWIKALFK